MPGSDTKSFDILTTPIIILTTSNLFKFGTEILPKFIALEICKQQIRNLHILRATNSENFSVQF